MWNYPAKVLPGILRQEGVPLWHAHNTRAFLAVVDTQNTRFGRGHRNVVHNCRDGSFFYCSGGNCTMNRPFYSPEPSVLPYGSLHMP